MRSGRYVKQPTGYRAFIPAPLPPDPEVHVDAELLCLLSEADRALGRLDGATSILPNPDLFVAMYVRQEAVLSSQIEGTQSTLTRRSRNHKVVNALVATNLAPLACNPTGKYYRAGRRWRRPGE